MVQGIDFFVSALRSQSTFKEKCGALQNNNSNKCFLYTMII